MIHLVFRSFDCATYRELRKIASLKVYLYMLLLTQVALKNLLMAEIIDCDMLLHLSNGSLERCDLCVCDFDHESELLGP